MRWLLALTLIGLSLGAGRNAAAQPPLTAGEGVRSTLKTGDAQKRIEALRQLPYVVEGPDQSAQAIGAVGELMYRDPDSTVRIAAYRCLTELQKQASRALEGDFRAALAKPGSDEERLAVEAVLGAPYNFQSLQLDLLGVSDCALKQQSARSMVKQYVSSLSAEALQRMIANSDDNIRQAGLEALEHQVRFSTTTMSFYLYKTWNDSPEERIRVLTIIRTTDRPRGQALEYVLKASEDSNLGVQCTAIETLGIWGAVTTPYLLKLASSESISVRCSALRGLGHNRPATEECIAALIDGLKSEHPPVVSTAARSLGEHGANAASAVPALVARLQNYKEVSPWGYEPTAALVDALGAIGPDAHEADGELRRLVDRTSPLRHVQIAQTLAKIHGDVTEGLPLLQATIEYAAENCDDEVMQQTLPLVSEWKLDSESFVQAIADYLERAHSLRRGEKQPLSNSPRMGGMLQAVDALKTMGPSAAAAEPILQRIFCEAAYRNPSLPNRVKAALEAIRNAPQSAEGKAD